MSIQKVNEPKKGMERDGQEAKLLEKGGKIKYCSTQRMELKEVSKRN